MSAELAAEEACRYAESIVQTVREPLLILDADLKIISANRNFYRTFIVTPDETIGSFYDLGNKQWDIPKLRELLETIIPQKATFDNYEVEHDFATIGRCIMLLNARQIQRVLGRERIILLAIEDITERKEIENGLEKTRKVLEKIKISEDEAREYAESIINTVREPLIALDQDLRVVKVSRSFYEVFKVKNEETMGQLIYDLGNKQWDIPKLRELLETILPEKATFDNYEVEHDFATIGRRIMLLNARQIQRVLGKERIILLAIEDITERKQSEEKIQQMAHHDTLTGLPNRKLFSDRLGIALAQAQRNQKKVGIAMLDLDHFKGVNDTLGHDVGDLLLKATAERLRAALRKGDTVARFGGDEFVLILPDLKGMEDVIQVAQKIVDSFHKPFLIDTHQLIVTTSIGIAFYPHDGTDESILLKNADIAMYQAKQAGRARYQPYKEA
jgi:diguanylate cyclase (GGDEF)-like protein/PAS domain S-box-containing protein